MKENNNISELLKKFYEGETSLEEEKFLKDYYKKSDNSAENAIFTAIDLEQKESVSSEFDKRLFSKINKKKTFYYRAVSIAAAILILCAPLIWQNMSERTVCVVDSAQIQIPKSPEANGIVITNQNYSENKALADKEIKKAFDVAEKSMDKVAKKLDKLDALDKGFEALRKMQNSKQNNKQSEV